MLTQVILWKCHELETEYGTSFTNSVLADADAFCDCVIKIIWGINKKKLIEKYHKKSPTS